MSEFASVSKLLADDGMRTLPIACRLVPLDQWLVTHVDTSWKIKDIKQWILSKCNIWESSEAPQPPRFRPSSPVTFSALSRRSSFESESLTGTEEGAGEDDWDDFAAIDYNAELRASDSALASSSAKTIIENTASEHAVSYYAPTQMAQRSSTERETDATSAQYTLVSFSNGFILEDDADLSWYKPRPFELFEVHRAGAVVSLPRDGISYAVPYFESPVRVSERPHHHKRPGQTQEDYQMQLLEWKTRWTIIRDGMLHLCKEAHTLSTHRFPLTALSALRGPEQFGLERSAYPRVICAKFNRTARSSNAISEEFDASIISPSQGKKKPKSSSWIILDMPNRSSYENILRVLHRSAPYPLSSSFVAIKTPTTPPSSMPSSRHRSRSSVILSSPTDSERSFDLTASAFFGVQYPEWRLALLQRCRMAGRGAIGSALSLALAHCLYTNSGSYDFYHQPLPRASSISEGLRRRAEQASVSGASKGDDAAGESDSSSLHPWKEALSEDDEEEDDDVESEIEWDGWVRDLSRRPTRPFPLSSLPPVFPTTSHTAGLSGALSPSSLSSSSEAEFDYSESGGTARVRTLSLSPQYARPSSSQRARSSTISAAGTVFGSTYSYTSTTTTIITTYIDRVPDLRDPTSSSTPETTRHHSYASPIASPPSPSPSSPRNTPRARRLRHPTGSPVTTAPPTQFTPPQSMSGPGSRAASVSGSEISSSMGEHISGTGTGTGTGRNAGIGGIRRIVRGVSIRGAFSTERFVRGLEDALDFVDGR